MPTYVTPPVTEADRPPDGLAVRSVNLLVVRCSDFDRSLAFYRSIGLPLGRYRVAHHDSTCASALVPGGDFALTADDPGADVPRTNFHLLPAAAGVPTGGMAFGFFVSSVDAAVESGLRHGGRLLTPAADWAYGRMAAIADPDGNRIELSEAPVGRLTGDYAP